MMMTHRSSDRGPATKRLSPPRMDLLFEVHHAFAPAETATVLNGTCWLMPAGGTRFEGARMSGRHLPGAVVIQKIQANGIMTREGLLPLETDDGHRLFCRVSGIASITPESALALSAGEAFEPGAFYVRGYARFEAADDGPYAWLNRCLCITKTIRLPEGLQTTAWQLL